MKKIIWIVVILAIVIGVFLIFNNKTDQDSSSSNETIKIGYSGIQTGATAWLGEQFAMGLRTAQSEINTEGGINGKLIEIIEQDNFYTGKGGVNAFYVLESQNVELIISIGSVPTVTLSPLARDAGIPLLAASLYADVLADNPNAVRITAVPQTDASVTISDMKKNNIEKVGVIYINNEYGVANLNGFKDVVADSGIELVNEVAMMPGSTDFATPALKVLEGNVDAVYVIDLAYVPIMTSLQTQINARGENISVYSNVVAYASGAVSRNPELFEGIRLTTSIVSVSGTEERNDFIEKLGLTEDTAGGLLNQAYGYDSLMAIAKVLESNPDLSNFVEEFSTFGEFVGIGGAYNLNSRDVGVPLLPAVFTNGVLTLVEE